MPEKNMIDSVTQYYNCLDGTLLWAPTFGSEKKTKPFLHLSLGKAGPFTLESHICVKALKCNVFQIIRCLIKILLENSTQTIFQGGTSWVAQILNNIIVWMVLYCEHQLLGVKKSKTSEIN